MLEVVRAERAAMKEIMDSIKVYHVGNQPAIMSAGNNPQWLPVGTTAWKMTVMFDRETPGFKRDIDPYIIHQADIL